MTVARLSNPVKKQKYWLKAFLFGTGISFLLFLPFVIYDQGLFLYYGDFNVQQIPFYQMIHDAIRSGNWGWSHTTDLGANMIGSYSFYLLGSPFFWLTMPFPSEAVPYLMAPLLVLKIGCASLAAYIFLRRYVINKDFAVIGAVLYAFSGFSIYNIFFNHFHEAIIIFPLLLAAVDEFMATKRRGVLALAVFAACIFNYYFFVGEVVFVIIFWVAKMLTHSYNIKLKDFFLMAFEIIIGFAASSILLVPAVLTVMQNPRTDSAPNGWGAVVYYSGQLYVNIIESFFFPPDIPARPNFAPDISEKWSSVAAWLPMFGMTGVIAFLQGADRKHWLKKVLPLLFLMALVPVLNSAFQLFNSSYYARWFFMLTLVMSLATIKALEDTKRTNWRRAITWSMGFIIFITVIIGFMPSTKSNSDGTKTTTYGLMKYPDRFWIYVAIAIISVALTALVVKQLKTNKKQFVRSCFACLGVVIIAYSFYILVLGKSQGYDSHNYIIPHVINKGDTIDLPETDNVRSDFYNCMDNNAMFWQIPTIQAFHSIVPGSIMDFYPSIGVTRDVGSRPETSVYGLRSFTSTRWLFDYNLDANSFQNSDGKTLMPGWSYYNTQNNYDIYENEYYIPMGFTYTDCISEEEYEECGVTNRNLLLLKAMVLNDEQIAKYSYILKETDNYMDYDYTTKQYYNDCLNRRTYTCENFAYDNGGFSADIDLTNSSKDQLVFFSVPYEDGFSATVNGEPAEIEKVNIGFMAVKATGGQVNSIRFNYSTPGLQLGMIITFASVVIFALYMIIFGNKFNKTLKKHKIGRRYRTSSCKANPANLYLSVAPTEKPLLLDSLKQDIYDIAEEKTDTEGADNNVIR